MDRERTPASLHGSPTGFASRRSEMGQLLDALRRARSTVRSRHVPEFEGPQRFEGDPVALTLALHPAGLRSGAAITAPGAAFRAEVDDDATGNGLRRRRSNLTFASGVREDGAVTPRPVALVTAPFRGEGMETLRSVADVVYDPWIEQVPAAPLQRREARRPARAPRAPTSSSSSPTSVKGPVFDLPLQVHRVVPRRSQQRRRRGRDRGRDPRAPRARAATPMRSPRSRSRSCSR